MREGAALAAVRLGRRLPGRASRGPPGTAPDHYNINLALVRALKTHVSRTYTYTLSGGLKMGYTCATPVLPTFAAALPLPTFATLAAVFAFATVLAFAAILALATAALGTLCALCALSTLAALAALGVALWPGRPRLGDKHEEHLLGALLEGRSRHVRS